MGVRRWASRHSGGDKDDGPVSWGSSRAGTGVLVLANSGSGSICGRPRTGRDDVGIWLGVCFLKDGVVTANCSGLNAYQRCLRASIKTYTKKRNLSSLPDYNYKNPFFTVLL